ncbi:MAG: DDE-type integrase/transposase/recombinase [Micropruina sp.]|nr:DDE-type integrase/transposase/recombinase [Micropruina sp.]
MVTPEPAKRPRASYRRFRYPDPNGCWQLDGFEVGLDDEAGSKRCVLQVEDDHSRFILASHVARSETAEAAITVVSAAIGRHGAPARFLTDNGTAFNLSRQGKITQLERYLRHLGVEPITGRPRKPTTQGKNERLHQTIQQFLDAHRPIRTSQRLTELIDEFDDYYNTQRAHQALDHPDQTPAESYQAKPKALPGPPTHELATPITPRPTPGPITPGIHRRMKGERAAPTTPTPLAGPTEPSAPTAASTSVTPRSTSAPNSPAKPCTSCSITPPSKSSTPTVSSSAQYPTPGTIPTGGFKVLTIHPRTTRPQ